MPEWTGFYFKFASSRWVVTHHWCIFVEKLQKACHARIACQVKHIKYCICQHLFSLHLCQNLNFFKRVEQKDTNPTHIPFLFPQLTKCPQECIEFSHVSKSRVIVRKRHCETPFSNSFGASSRPSPWSIGIHEHASRVAKLPSALALS